MKLKHWMSIFKGVKHKFGDGSQIRPLNRDWYVYTQPDGYSIDIEAYVVGEGPDEVAIVKNSLSQWSPPHQSEAVPAAKQEEVLQKIKDYFDERGVRYRVEAHPK